MGQAMLRVERDPAGGTDQQQMGLFVVQSDRRQIGMASQGIVADMDGQGLECWA